MSDYSDMECFRIVTKAISNNTKVEPYIVDRAQKFFDSDVSYVKKTQSKSKNQSEAKEQGKNRNVLSTEHDAALHGSIHSSIRTTTHSSTHGSTQTNTPSSSYVREVYQSSWGDPTFPNVTSSGRVCKKPSRYHETTWEKGSGACNVEGMDGTDMTWHGDDFDDGID